MTHHILVHAAFGRDDVAKGAVAVLERKCEGTYGAVTDIIEATITLQEDLVALITENDLGARRKLSGGLLDKSEYRRSLDQLTRLRVAATALRRSFRHNDPDLGPVGSACAYVLCGKRGPGALLAIFLRIMNMETSSE